MADKTKELLDEALNNIRSDRQETANLLKDLKSAIAADKADYAKSGATTAKFLESLQRSNDQLVRIVLLLAKTSGELDERLDEEDKAEVYELIKASEKKKAASG